MMMKSVEIKVCGSSRKILREEIDNVISTVAKLPKSNDCILVTAILMKILSGSAFKYDV